MPRKIFVIVIGKTLVVFVNTWTSNDKYSVPNSDNFSLSIQLLLFKKRKSFVNFLFRFWNLHQNLNILKKKMIVIAIVFPKLQTGKTCLGHSLRSAISEHLLTINILKGRKHFWNLCNSTFIIVFITLGETDSEHVSLSDIWTVRGVC